MRLTLGFMNRQRQLAKDYQRVAELLAMSRRNIQGLDNRDFMAAGKQINVHPAHLKAFHLVESSGDGFGPGNRLKILYEPHVVHRETKGKLAGVRIPWMHDGKEIEVPISYRKWKPLGREVIKGSDWHPYDLSQEDRWGLLASAYELHPDVLRGVSWGGFQVLGKWATSIGYRSTLDMIDRFYEGEAEHLAGAMRFLAMASPNAIPALRVGNWALVARYYNGPGQVAKFAGLLERKASKVMREFPGAGRAFV